MQNIVSRSVGELPEASRRSLEALLGQQLQANQRVFIMIVDPSVEATGDQRAGAASGLRQIIAQAERHSIGIGDAEIDAATAEAMAVTRLRDLMRVVLDTNVLVRALPGRKNAAELVLLKAIEPPHVLVLSAFILDELSRVLRYERQRQIHGLDDARIDEFVGHLANLTVHVPIPAAAVGAVVLADPNDDPIVATAVLGQADVLCTWDRHFYDPSIVEHLQRFGVRVMREPALLAELHRQNDA